MPKILKDKHRDRPWFDHDGDLWFWNEDREEWVIVYYTGVWSRTAENGVPDAAYGPYRLAIPKVD